MMQVEKIYCLSWQVMEAEAEGVPLIEQEFNAKGSPTGKWKALDIEQYGPSGIVAMLEQADVWSGRGEHRSLLEFFHEVVNNNRARREKVRNAQREFIRDRAADRRRQVLGIPLIQVGIELGRKLTRGRKSRPATQE